jgi:hypothetical protein
MGGALARLFVRQQFVDKAHVGTGLQGLFLVTPGAA